MPSACASSTAASSGPRAASRALPAHRGPPAARSRPAAARRRGPARGRGGRPRRAGRRGAGAGRSLGRVTRACPRAGTAGPGRAGCGAGPAAVAAARTGAAGSARSGSRCRPRQGEAVAAQRELRVARQFAREDRGLGEPVEGLAVDHLAGERRAHDGVERVAALLHRGLARGPHGRQRDDVDLGADVLGPAMARADQQAQDGLQPVVARVVEVVGLGGANRMRSMRGRNSVESRLDRPAR